MSSIKRETGRTQLEHEGLTKQLERVGVTAQPDGTLDPTSLGNVKGGAAAVAVAAGADQVLTANEAESLRKNGLISQLFSPISDRATKNAQALTLSVTALSKVFDAALSGDVDAKSLSRRAKALEKDLSNLFDGMTLGKVGPETRAELANALSDLSRTSSTYVLGLIRRRQEFQGGIDEGTSRLVGSGNGFTKRLGGLGSAFLAAIATTELTKLIDMMQPLTIIARDLIAPGGATRPLQRYVETSLDGAFDAKGTKVLVDLATELEDKQKYRGITRYSVVEGLHGLLERYYGVLHRSDGGDFVARRNSELLKKHASPEMKRSLQGEDTQLTVAEVFAAMIRAAASASSDGERGFLQNLH